eukprot:COSAG03_NODE_10582_length_641_cov_5.752768_1_plen_70_part_10
MSIELVATDEPGSVDRPQLMTAANRRLAALRTHLHGPVVGHAGGTARAVVREHARGAAPAVLFDDARMKE